VSHDATPWYDTIYDTRCLVCAVKLTDSQLNLPHRIKNEKYKEKESLNKTTSEVSLNDKWKWPSPLTQTIDYYAVSWPLT